MFDGGLGSAKAIIGLTPAGAAPPAAAAVADFHEGNYLSAAGNAASAGLAAFPPTNVAGKVINTARRAFSPAARAAVREMAPVAREALTEGGGLLRHMGSTIAEKATEGLKSQAMERGGNFAQGIYNHGFPGHTPQAPYSNAADVSNPQPRPDLPSQQQQRYQQTYGSLAKAGTVKQAFGWGDALGAAKTVGSFLPGVGSAIGGYDAVKDFSKGNYWSGLGNLGVAGLGLLPGVGGVGNGLLRGGKMLGRLGGLGRALGGGGRMANAFSHAAPIMNHMGQAAEGIGHGMQSAMPFLKHLNSANRIGAAQLGSYGVGQAAQHFMGGGEQPQAPETTGLNQPSTWQRFQNTFGRDPMYGPFSGPATPYSQMTPWQRSRSMLASMPPSTGVAEPGLNQPSMWQRFQNTFGSPNASQQFLEQSMPFDTSYKMGAAMNFASKLGQAAARLEKQAISPGSGIRGLAGMAEHAVPAAREVATGLGGFGSRMMNAAGPAATRLRGGAGSAAKYLPGAVGAAGATVVGGGGLREGYNWLAGNGSPSHNVADYRDQQEAYGANQNPLARYGGEAWNAITHPFTAGASMLGFGHDRFRHSDNDTADGTWNPKTNKVEYSADLRPGLAMNQHLSNIRNSMQGFNQYVDAHPVPGMSREQAFRHYAGLAGMGDYVKPETTVGHGVGDNRTQDQILAANRNFNNYMY